VVMKLSRIFLFGALALILSSVSCAIAVEPTPSLATIIQRTVERDDENQKILKTMEYPQMLKTQRLDDNGQVSQQQELHMIIRPGATQEVQVLLAKGDNLPSDPDQAAQQAQGKAAQVKKMDFSLKDMANRFNVSLVGMNTFEGVPVYVVAFEPKPNQPFRDQTEKVLDQLKGRIWIDASDYMVLKTEANLAAPVEVAWVFAEITEVNFHYELHNTTGGLGPASITTSVKLDAPFITFRQRMIVEMGEVTPRDKKIVSGN
jgi:hypothetical protein